MSKVKKAVLLLIIANIIWGAGSPIFKWSFYAIHPFTLAFLRFVLPAIFLAFVYHNNKHTKLKWKDIPMIFITGFFVITLNITFFFLGIQKTLSIDAPIIGSSGPIFLVLASVIFLHEKLRIRTLLGNLLGLTGVLLIIIEPLLHTNSGGSVVGNVLLIFSMLTGVAGTIFAKKIIGRYSPLSATYYTFLIGSISFLFPAIKEIQTYGLLPQLAFPGIVGILFGSILSSYIGYYFFFWGLKYLPASELSVFTYIDPIAGVLIAMPLLHEYPNTFFLFGSFLVFLGIYIAEGRIHYHPLHKLFKT